jgi:hypothetical protein
MVAASRRVEVAMFRGVRALVLAGALGALGCLGEVGGPPSGTRADGGDSAVEDAGVLPSNDAGLADAGAFDAGAPSGDAGADDAGIDGGRPTDAGSAGAGGADAGPTDAGSIDAGTPDAGRADAGPGDAGTGPTLGAHALAFFPCGGSGTLATPPISTRAAGSTVLALVARGDLSAFAGHAPIDNRGNLAVQVGTTHDYAPLWPTSGEALYAFSPLQGGANHVFSTTLPAPDEITLAVVEVRDTAGISDVAWNKVLSGAPNTSLTVTTTGPATLVAVWLGDGVAAQMTAVPSAGFTVIDSQLVNSTCAVQAVIATRQVGAGSWSVAWAETPEQGAHLWLVALQ